MIGRDDRGRQGSVESKPYSFYVKQENEKISEKIPICDVHGRRSDGRKVEEIRPVHLRTGVVTQAKGSSYFEKDGVKVVCAVYGPRESQRKTEFSTKGRIICDVTFAPFSQPTRQLKAEESKTKRLSDLLETALLCAVCLDSFPKSQVEVFVKVLEDSGDVLSGAIISASLALADARIEMYDLVTACSLVFDGDYIALDPTYEEVNQDPSRGCLMLGYLPSLNRISCMIQNGTAATERNIVFIKKCIEGCIRMHGVMQDCLVNGSLKKEEQQLSSKDLH